MSKQETPPRDYRVRIEIDVAADDPTQAAIEAWEMLRHPEALGWVCDVQELVDLKPVGETTQVDLERVLRSD